MTLDEPLENFFEQKKRKDSLNDQLVWDVPLFYFYGDYVSQKQTHIDRLMVLCVKIDS